jgi:hypothetical protein
VGRNQFKRKEFYLKMKTNALTIDFTQPSKIVAQQIHALLKDSTKYIFATASERLSMQRKLGRVLYDSYYRSRLVSDVENYIDTGDTRQLCKDVISWSNSRKARGGLMFEQYFLNVAKDYNIPLEAHPKELSAELDMIFPSAAAYLDKSVPRSEIGIIECKSTSRERWRQLSERYPDIPNRYLIVSDLDKRITDETIVKMDKVGVTCVVPKDFLGRLSQHPNVISLEQLFSFIKKEDVSNDLVEIIDKLKNKVLRNNYLICKLARRLGITETSVIAMMYHAGGKVSRTAKKWEAKDNNIVYKYLGRPPTSETIIELWEELGGDRSIASVKTRLNLMRRKFSGNI